MKLRCNHDRRALVLPSGNTVHRSDGSQCLGKLSIGGNKVTKLYSQPEGKFVDLGISRPKPGEKAAELLTEIFGKVE